MNNEYAWVASAKYELYSCFSAISLVKWQNRLDSVFNFIKNRNCVCVGDTVQQARGTQTTIIYISIRYVALLA